MNIYDISQNIFDCKVYPGDPLPNIFNIRDINDGDQYNLTQVNIGTHIGTHIDAPLHYIKEGKSIGDLPIDIFVGECIVMEVSDHITGAFIEKYVPSSCERLIFKTKGQFYLDKSGANALAYTNVRLVGIDKMSIASEQDERATHCALLSNDIVILEGLFLDNIQKGKYFLHCPPINLSSCEAAPCRATLIENHDNFELLPVFNNNLRR